MSRSVGLLVGLGVALVLGRARAEEEPVPTLRADAARVRRLDGARDYLRAGDWAEATRALQGLLDGDDALVPVRRPGREGPAWVGLRAEAARTLAAIPAAGREYYETTYGPRARALLARAKRQGNPALAAEVARRYPLTAAGVEAAGWVAVAHLDRGRDALAALCFARLLERPGADALAPAVLFRAALAFRRAGDRARAELAWKQVAARAPAGLRLSGKDVSLAELRRQLEDAPAPEDRGQKTEDRPSVALSSVFCPLEARWARPTAHEAFTRVWLQTAADEQEDRGQPPLPAFAPLVVGGRVVYRSHRGLHAVGLATGKQAWEAAAEWSTDRLVANGRHGSTLETWVKAYLEASPHVLAGNGVVGTLSADGARVYAVDDLGVPPYPNYYRFRGRWRADPDTTDLGPELTAAASSSRLLALDAATGKPAWEVGGARPGAALVGHCFLGPPLALGGRLYVLADKDNEVSLVCLSAADGAVVWRRPLALAPTRLALDPGRRVQAAVPVHADGVLVCPTNSGLVAGVDLLTPGLAWAYPYRTTPLTQSQSYGGRGGRTSRPRVTAEWPAAFTAVAGGRVVFAAPDEPSVHCLALRDGTPLWKVPRGEDDLYVAGVLADRVLIVGKRHCRALALADGKPVWRVETGLPSGRGVAAGDVYYLPLKAPAGGKGPAVWGLEVRKGTVVARHAAPRDEPPGNLLLWRGELLAQTATAVTAYREKTKTEDRGQKTEDGKKKEGKKP
jgi:outer membrane protein assembly factor BamB